MIVYRGKIHPCRVVPRVFVERYAHVLFLQRPPYRLRAKNEILAKHSILVLGVAEGDGADLLTEHYIWRAIEHAKRIADKIDERWPAKSQSPVEGSSTRRDFERKFW
jgi:hypothetical protein